MSTRNFTFRVPPVHGQRGSRYVLAGSTALTSGVPVLVGTGNDGLGRQEVTLATGDQAIPLAGKGGILVFENINFDGYDQVITTASDVDLAQVGEAVQVVSGKGIKVALTNTTETSFLTRSGYPKARIMVAGVGATPTVAVGDKLAPGTGNDSAGYWAETSTAANAWLTVTSVNASTGVVEAVLNF